MYVIQANLIGDPKKIRQAQFYHRIHKKKLYDDEKLFIAKVFFEGGAAFLSSFFIKEF